MTDEELIRRIRGSDSAVSAASLRTLMERYKKEINRKARAYYLIGSDWQDLVQEGMIALYKAVLGYRESSGPFAPYAATCINTGLVSALRASLRDKNKILNGALSLDEMVEDEEGESRSRGDTIPDTSVPSPEDSLMGEYGATELMSTIKSLLSVKENKVLDLYLEGNSYTEIASLLEISVKSADNAIQRIRRKIKAARL